MLEINRIVFVLLLEGLALFVLLTFLLAGMAFVRKRNRARAIRQLAAQVRHQSSLRLEQTESFLKAIYQLEEEELPVAVQNIDKQEKRFFQHLINVIYTEDNQQIASLDAVLAELIDCYKSLRPRQQATNPADEELIAETAALKKTNDRLRDELAITKETMSNMIGEFGNMFGGGADHELAKHEVVEKISDPDLQMIAALEEETGETATATGAGEESDTAKTAADNKEPGEAQVATAKTGPGEAQAVQAGEESGKAEAVKAEEESGEAKTATAREESAA